MASWRIGSIWAAIVCILSVCTHGCGGDSASTPDAGDVASGEDVAETADKDSTPGDVPDDGTSEDAEVGFDTAETTGVEVMDDVGPTEPPSTGWPAHELLVRVTEPAGDGAATVSSGTVRLTGHLFGNATGLQWQLGLQSGAIAPGRVWQSGPIALSEGDNRITVTATDGVAVASDTVIITFNSNWRFGAAPRLTPQVGWVGETATVFVEVAIEAQNTPTSGPLQFISVDADGGFLATEGALADDGRLVETGDEIAGDQVYTRRLEIDCSTEGPRFFRVRVPASTGRPAESQVVRYDCLRRVTRAACDASMAMLRAARERLASGEAVEVVLEGLRGEAQVAEVGQAPGGSRAVWVRFANGLLGAVLDPTDGYRAGPVVAVAGQMVGVLTSNNVAPIGSLRAVFGTALEASVGSDEVRWLAERLGPTTCPPVAPVGPVGDVGLATLRVANGAGIVALATHGETLFGGMAREAVEARGWRHVGHQEALLTSTPVVCESLSEAPVACVATPLDPTGGCAGGGRCIVTETIATADGAAGRGTCSDQVQADMVRGRVVLSTDGYLVLPAFFQDVGARQRWAGGVFHAGACRSMWNGSLAATLLSVGVGTVTGFSDRVGHAYATAAGEGLFGRLLAGETLDVGAPAPEEDAFGARLRVVGATRAALGGGALLNGDFGSGSLSGWEARGDGRVVGRFGEATPVTGKFMGLLSTGLGYTVGTGSIEQTVCIPEGARTLGFFWRLYSEEFREWCGDSAFEDSFEIRATDTSGETISLATIQIDDLCGYGDGACADCPAPVSCDAACFGADGCTWNDVSQACEGAFNCSCGKYFNGLETSDVQFDQGGVWRTAWRENTVDVSRLAGRGPVTLRFGVRDSGDSLFDSAVLLDALRID
jgi:hypothetical protein